MSEGPHSSLDPPERLRHTEGARDPKRFAKRITLSQPKFSGAFQRDRVRHAYFASHLRGLFGTAGDSQVDSLKR